jgi:hypothetical protein
MKFLRFLSVDISRLGSVIATLAAAGALTAIVPPHYKPYAAAVAAVALALHPSPLNRDSSVKGGGVS